MDCGTGDSVNLSTRPQKPYLNPSINCQEHSIARAQEHAVLTRSYDVKVI
jgi:hypothetical protein